MSKGHLSQALKYDETWYGSQFWRDTHNISDKNQAFKPLITTVKLQRFLSPILFHLDFIIREEHRIHAVKRQRTAGDK